MVLRTKSRKNVKNRSGKDDGFLEKTGKKCGICVGTTHIQPTKNMLLSGNTMLSTHKLTIKTCEMGFPESFGF